jgi:4-hydroxybenzoyl-CoA reductase subunit beta
MLPLPRFTHHAPTTLDEAVRLLHALGPDTHVIAGGTDLVPNMKQGLIAPRHVVSLQRVESLRGITLLGETIRIGAMTTLDGVSRDGRVREAAPALAEAARAVGGPHHRRMGTMGGNLCLDTRCRYYNQTHFWRDALGYCLKKDGTVCHVVSGGQKCVAAASNDTATAMIALEGALELLSARGTRTIDARLFYTADGIKNTVRADDEIVTAALVPVRNGRRSAYEKLRMRGSIDFPMLSVATSVDGIDGKLQRVEVVVSALAARPRRVSAAQHVAPGTSPSEELVTSLAQAAWRECRPMPNIDGDESWRHEMVPVLVERALRRCGVGG